MKLLYSSFNARRVFAVLFLCIGSIFSLTTSSSAYTSYVYVGAADLYNDHECTGGLTVYNTSGVNGQTSGNSLGCRGSLPNGRRFVLSFKRSGNGSPILAFSPSDFNLNAASQFGDLFTTGTIQTDTKTDAQMIAYLESALAISSVHSINRPSLIGTYASTTSFVGSFKFYYSGRNYTWNGSAIENGTHITVKSGVVDEGAAPTSSLTLMSYSASSAIFRATFSEPISSIQSEKISITNGTFVSAVGSGTTYDIEVLPTGGTLSISLTAGAGYTASSNATAPSSAVTVSSNAALASLTLSNGTFTSAFSSSTFSYSASVLNSISSITLTPLAADANASITVNGTSAVSGSAYGPIDLAEGTNLITTIVTAPDTVTQKTYVTTVTRTSIPTLNISTDASSLTVGETATVSFEFSNQPFGFTAADINTISGTISNFAVDGSDPKKFTATFTPTVETEATGSISVADGTFTDQIGNSGIGDNTSVAIDTLPPIISMNGPISGNDRVNGTEQASITVEGTSSGAPDGSSVTLTISDSTSSLSFSTNVQGGYWSKTIDISSLSDGTVTLAAYTVDENNNASNHATRTLVKDTLPPAGHSVNFIQAAISSTNVTAIGFAVEGTETGATLGYVISSNGGGTPVTGAATVTDSSYSLSNINLSGLADGIVTVAVIITDPDGNSASTVSDQIVKDTSALSVTLVGPTGVVTGEFDVTITFNKLVTGFLATDLVVTNGSVAEFTGTGTTYSASIVPVLGLTVTLDVPADVAIDAVGNGNIASAQYAILAGSPASEFEAVQHEVQSIISSNAQRTLSGAIAGNRRMISDARARLIDHLQNKPVEDGGYITRNFVPFDVDGTFTLNANTLSTSGAFYEQTGSYSGDKRRLVFGTFDFQHDRTAGSSTGLLSMKVAWEFFSNQTDLFGYFLGADISRHEIAGTMNGVATEYGLNAGIYGIKQIAENLYWDSIISVGRGFNSFQIADANLELTSDYVTRSASIGTAISGDYEWRGTKFRPELSASYGQTWVGTIGLVGEAYGLTDSGLTLDIGHISVANVMLRPQVIWDLASEHGTDVQRQVSFSPRFTCERQRALDVSQDCGTGVELTFTSHTTDPNQTVDFRFTEDHIGTVTRTSYQLDIKWGF